MMDKGSKDNLIDMVAQLSKIGAGIADVAKAQIDAMPKEQRDKVRPQVDELTKQIEDKKKELRNIVNAVNKKLKTF